MKTTFLAKENLIDRTIETWRPRLNRDMTREDARQIVENVTGFFSILAEWTRAVTPTPADDTGKTTASGDDEVQHDG